MLLHGHGGHRFAMSVLERALRRSGYATLRIGYPSLTRSLPVLRDAVIPQVDQFGARFSGPLHFVGHSFGGLLIRAIVTQARPERLGRVVMLGTPNGGSELADWLQRIKLGRLVLGPAASHLMTLRAPDDAATVGSVDFPLGINAGTRPLLARLSNLFLPLPNDGKVSVASTHTAGQADHIAVPVAHMMLPYDREVVRQTLAFLAHDVSTVVRARGSRRGERSEWPTRH